MKLNEIPTGLGVSMIGMARNILDAAGEAPIQLILDERMTVERLVAYLRLEIQICNDGEPVRGLSEWLESSAKPHEDETDTLNRLFREVADLIPVKVDYLVNRK